MRHRGSGAGLEWGDDGALGEGELRAEGTGEAVLDWNEQTLDGGVASEAPLRVEHATEASECDALEESDDDRVCGVGGGMLRCGKRRGRGATFLRAVGVWDGCAGDDSGPGGHSGCASDATAGLGAGAGVGVTRVRRGRGFSTRPVVGFVIATGPSSSPPLTPKAPNRSARLSVSIGSEDLGGSARAGRRIH